MAKTAKDLTSDDMEQYRNFLKEKEEKEKMDLQQRYYKAWDIARKAAKILYDKYCAKKVFVFGSLTNPEKFTKWSDIDLAVWGIPDDFFYKAVAEMISLNSEIKIDLVDPEECGDDLKKAIEREGLKI
ncbi:nucleotidyltransferase family protein [Thermoanaerobacterium sp. DL9XJH110]|uniref:nucleotidyltransferase family protein n=1 Tax=Thermoanaerobacterium sp. DL9XJH110 TaxID=3386643 RepID=UPI003BB5F879